MSRDLNTLDTETTDNALPDSSVAVTRTDLIRVLRRMPDGQSAVVVAIAYLAARGAPVSYGPFAGKLAARTSAVELAELIGRPLRTTHHALARLAEAGTVRNVRGLQGRWGLYVLADEETGAIRRPSRGSRWAKPG